MTMKYLLAGCAMVAATAVSANELEIALGGDTAALKIVSDSASIGAGGADLQLGAFYNDDDDYMFDLGMIVQGRPAGEHPTSFGLGAKAMVGGVDNPDLGFGAVGLGGKVSHHIPNNMPVTLSAEIFYAPSITSFNDAESVMDLTVRAEMDVLPAASLFVGYRQLSVEFENISDDYDLDDEFHIGMSFQY